MTMTLRSVRRRSCSMSSPSVYVFPEPDWPQRNVCLVKPAAASCTAPRAAGRAVPRSRRAVVPSRESSQRRSTGAGAVATCPPANGSVSGPLPARLATSSPSPRIWTSRTSALTEPCPSARTVRPTCPSRSRPSGIVTTTGVPTVGAWPSGAVKLNRPSPKDQACVDAVAISAVRRGHLVDHRGDGEDQDLVLAGLDLDAVGVRHAEPPLGHLSDGAAVRLDLVLVVEEVALHVQVGPARDLDRHPVTQRSDHGLLHPGNGAAARVLDLHRVADPHHALLDPQQRGAVRVVEVERLPDAERLAVHLVRAPAVAVLDPVVVTDGDQLLAHPVVHRPALLAPALVSLFPSSPKHHGFLRSFRLPCAARRAWPVSLLPARRAAGRSGRT